MNIHDFLLKYRLPLFNKEDEQGGGGDPDAGAGDDGAGNAPDTPPETALGGGLLDRRTKEPEGDDKGAEGDQGEADDGRPDGIPEKFWDAKEGAVKTDAMAKAYADLEKAHGQLKRDKQGTGKDVPESAEDYFKDGLDLGDDVKNLSVQGPDDPGLKAWGDVCHKYGIGKELATNLAKDMFGMMDQHAPAPIDPDAEFDKLGKGADALIDGVFVYYDGLQKSGQLSAEDADQVNELAKTANGIRFLANMRAMAGEEAIPMVASSGERGMTRDQWDTAFKAAVNSQDYAEQERLEKIGESIFGTGTARGGPAGGVNADKNGLRRAK